MSDFSNKNFYLGATGHYAPNLLVTNPYKGFNIDAGLFIQEKNYGYSLSVFGEQDYVKNKLLPDADFENPNSYTEGTLTQFGFGAGTWTRGKEPKKGYSKSLVSLSGSEFGFKAGWQNFSNPQLDYSQSFPLFSTYQRQIKAIQWWPTEKMYLMPYVGLESNARYTCTDMKQFEEWPSSAYGYSLIYGLKLGFGNIGGKTKKPGDRWNGADIGMYFADEAVGIVHGSLLYSQFDRPQNDGMRYLEDTRLFDNGSGSARADHMWEIASLRTLTMAMSGERGKVLDYYYNVPEKYRWAGLAVEGAKGLGYGIAGLAEDKAFLSPAYTSAGNLLTVGANELFNVREDRRFLTAFLLGAAQQLLSNVSDNQAVAGMMGSGTALAVKAVQSPDYGGGDFIESTSYIYMPYSYMWGDKSGNTGQIIVKKNFKNSLLYTEFDLTAPWVKIDNFGNIAGNNFKDYDNDSEYDNTNLPGLISTRVGLEKEIDISERVKFSVGGALGTTSYVSNGDMETGISASALVALDIGITKDYAINLSVSASAFVTPNHYGGTIGAGIGFTFAVG